MEYMNNQQIYNYLLEIIKQKDSQGYITSYPKNGQQVYVAYCNGEEIQALSMAELKELVEAKIHENTCDRHCQDLCEQTEVKVENVCEI